MKTDNAKNHTEKSLCTTMSRRTFLKSAAFGAAAFTAAAAMEQPLLAATVGQSAAAFGNGAIQFHPESCIGCGKCVEACNSQGLNVLELFAGKSSSDDLNDCIGCGQCTRVCPARALTEQDGLTAVQTALNSDRTIVWQFAPSVQHIAGELFGLPSGQDVSAKLAAAVHLLGGIAYRTDCGADFTIMEEAAELVERLQHGGPLPLITSCCPGWINYAQQNRPDLIDQNISSCKSPMEMLAALVKQKHTDCYHVAVMPCTAKKIEASRTVMQNAVDQVLTVREFGRLLEARHINLAVLQDDSFDVLFDENSGAGRIFGVTGGVMEAALRTAYQMLTGKPLQQAEISALRGNEGVRTAEVQIHNQIIRVAIVNGIANAETVLPNMQQYHFIEVMACPGGCAGGGGTPSVSGTVMARQNGMYAADRISKIRRSHENTDVQKWYEEKSLQPGSADILHVKYKTNL